MLKHKSLQSVAEAVKKVWAEELTGNQKKIDKNHNGKVDGQDLAILRKEGWDDMMKAVKDKAGPQPNGGAGKKQGTAYGGSKQKDEKPVKEETKFDPLKHIAKDKQTPAIKAAAKLVEPTSYADRAALNKAGGVKDDRGPRGVTQEEASQAEFTAELKKAQAKASAKAKQADVAKPAVQAVQNEQTHTEIQVIDLTNANGIKMSTIDLAERHLDPEEKAEMEKNVKGMKKNLQGFKDRYGDRAKSVMYATATKQAKGE
jgi:hypothetical protein